MNRDDMLDRVRREPDGWDVIIIGGGATGLGCAIDAASRGYRTLLLERDDFAKGTSSRSTKLVHGGVRYLQQGDVSLVLEALKERGLLRKNAPHLVHSLAFVVPNYKWWEGPFYGIGLKVYDMLAGKQGFGRSRNLSKKKTLKHLPTLDQEGLGGGVIYYDGQFDDARLAVNMAQTAAEQGGTLVNYVQVTGLIKSNGKVRGVEARDVETGQTHALHARSVINATGVFTDSIRRLDQPNARPMIQPSQGVHIVLDKSFLPGETAIMVPKTDDGRVLFAIPWHGKVLVGTTDTPVSEASAEPIPLEEEISFLLEHVARYLNQTPTREDVCSVFAGLRPLVQDPDADSTAALSRDHTLSISSSGLVTIAGGKWTTYRKMAEDTIDEAAALAGLEERPSGTEELHIHGYHQNAQEFGDLAVYGSDASALKSFLQQDSVYRERLHPDHPITAGQVVWAARYEMARTVEDVLARRTRLIFLDARASMQVAPRVAALLAVELGRDQVWQDEQLAAYQTLVQGYRSHSSESVGNDHGDAGNRLSASPFEQG